MDANSLRHKKSAVAHQAHAGACVFREELIIPTAEAVAPIASAPEWAQDLSMTNDPRKTPARRPVKIATQLLGGLGNQLFQYAAGRALAERLGARLVLDSTPRYEQFRPIVLGRLAIDAEIVNDAVGRPRRRYFRIPGTLGRRLTDSIHDHLPTTYRIDGHAFRVFGERRLFAHDPAFEKLSGSTYLVGYWQSYRYFEGAADQIRREIRPTYPPSEANRMWLSRIQAGNSVCLHVRRGDYLGGKADSPVVCGRSYYRGALQHVSRFLTAPKLFIFSDDIPWCRSAFAGKDVAFVDSNGPDDAIDDLLLMTACRHHIIANSSLSWWGAWLAHHPEQVVIAPQPWLPRADSDRDLLPTRWIKLSKT
jgi:Glycosyl transferase family 11